MDSEQKRNAGAKVVCAVSLVAVVAAAGVGLLVQHRKLDELRRECASVEKVNEQLVTNRVMLVSANDKLANELRVLRDAGRARAAEWAAAEKERTAWNAERAAWKTERESLVGRVKAWTETLSVLSNRVAEAAAEATEARTAQARAEKEAARLNAQVKDLKDANAKVRAEREKFRAERDRLERELNEAMQPAEEEDASVPVPAPVLTPAPDAASSADDKLVPVKPAPALDKRTPEERKAHEKEELNALIDL